jgi:hypothetical protein
MPSSHLIFPACSYKEYREGLENITEVLQVWSTTPTASESPASANPRPSDSGAPGMGPFTLCFDFFMGF